MVEELRGGGFILHFRHAQRQKWDSVIAFDVYEATTGVDGATASFTDAVCLTPQGVEEAKMIGEIFRLGSIPVGHVIASPSCRARQTALLAWGRIDAISTSIAHTPVTNHDNEKAFTAELKRILTTVPIEPGTNTIVSGHGNTLEYNPELFASGRDLLNRQALLETGCYAIRREPDGTLHLVRRFNVLGELAAHAIDLDPAARSPFAPGPPATGAPLP